MNCDCHLSPSHIVGAKLDFGFCDKHLRNISGIQTNSKPS